MARRRTRGRRTPEGRPGRVVATRGRRVLVRDAEGEERVCFLSGHRAVVGDQVLWVPARGSGGKLVDVAPRQRALVRLDFKGREQVVASHLGGLMIVAATQLPPYRAGLIDRYMLAASLFDLDVAVLLTKTDLGVPEAVEADLAWRETLGVPVLRVSVPDGEGIDAVSHFLSQHSAHGPWAFVGHSGVGKTSVIAALLPEIDVGPIGEVSEFWEQGTHTTTSSRIYRLPEGGELADSPGIRTFLPSTLDPADVRAHFPGIGPLPCRYRDCLHREGEDGCVAPEQVASDVLERYRRVLEEVTGIKARTTP